MKSAPTTALGRRSRRSCSPASSPGRWCCARAARSRCSACASRRPGPGPSSAGRSHPAPIAGSRWPSCTATPTPSLTRSSVPARRRRRRRGERAARAACAYVARQLARHAGRRDAAVERCVALLQCERRPRRRWPSWCARAGLGERQLQRRFAEVVGISPRALGGVDPAAPGVRGPARSAARHLVRAGAGRGLLRPSADGARLPPADRQDADALGEGRPRPRRQPRRRRRLSGLSQTYKPGRPRHLMRRSTVAHAEGPIAGAVQDGRGWGAARGVRQSGARLSGARRLLA